MDKKILKNSEKRQGLIDALYADHDIPLKEYAKLSMDNQHDTSLLLKADKRYDRKKH